LRRHQLHDCTPCGEIVCEPCREVVVAEPCREVVCQPCEPLCEDTCVRPGFFARLRGKLAALRATHNSCDPCQPVCEVEPACEPCQPVTPCIPCVPQK
jgi:hypothetical protein